MTSKFTGSDLLQGQVIPAQVQIIIHKPLGITACRIHFKEVNSLQ